MEQTQTDANERYASRVLASMMSESTNNTRFDDEIADEIVTNQIEELEINYQPMRHGDMSVSATLNADKLTNVKTTELYNFHVTEFFGLTRNEDGEVILQFAGIRTQNPLDISMNENGLFEESDGKKYTFIVRLPEL